MLNYYIVNIFKKVTSPFLFKFFQSMPRQLNEEEEAQIFKFFAEESENATSPFELNSFCSKFRKKYETDITHNDLKVM